jgi:hypothetical protein
MKYNTAFNVNLIPHGNPQIKYGIDGVVANEGLELTIPMTLQFSLDFDQGDHTFFIDFYNKTNDTPEMALEIASVSMEGMTLDRFKWAGVYYPIYPEPWYSQQTKVLPKYHNSATYLGWNGRWELTFSAPIFQWIHRLENLGWIYT